MVLCCVMVCCIMLCCDMLHCAAVVCGGVMLCGLLVFVMMWFRVVLIGMVWYGAYGCVVMLGIGVVWHVYRYVVVSHSVV